MDHSYYFGSSWSFRLLWERRDVGVGEGKDWSSYFREWHLTASGRNCRKSSLKEYYLLNSALKKTVPCCQKYTPTDGFFGDFAHWLRLLYFKRKMWRNNLSLLYLHWDFIHSLCSIPKSLECFGESEKPPSLWFVFPLMYFTGRTERMRNIVDMFATSGDEICVT